MFIFTYCAYEKRTCTRRTGGTHVLCGENANTEPPVMWQGCASAPPQLYSIFHSNPRDWEFPTRWTFLNNEGILCLQYSAWLSCTVGDVLHAKGRRKHDFSCQMPDHMPPWCFNMTNILFDGCGWVGSVLSVSAPVEKEAGQLIVAAVHMQALFHCWCTRATRVVIRTLQFISGHRGQISPSVLDSALLQGWRHTMLH